jgi:hypothetical protein
MVIKMKRGVKELLASARKKMRVVCKRCHRAARDPHIVIIAICTVAATVVSWKWDGIGGFVAAGGANAAKDLTLVVMDIEIEEE